MKNKENVGELILKELLISSKLINYFSNYFNLLGKEIEFLNLNDIALLMEIKRNPGVVTYGLAKKFKASNQRISYNINKLKSNDYLIVKSIKENNREKKKLYLKDETKELIDYIEFKIKNTIFENLETNELEMFLNLTEKYNNALDSIVKKL